MGLIRFAVHPATLLSDWPEVYSAYLSGRGSANLSDAD